MDVYQHAEADHCEKKEAGGSAASPGLWCHLRRTVAIMPPLVFIMFIMPPVIVIGKKHPTALRVKAWGLLLATSESRNKTYVIAINLENIRLPYRTFT